MTTFIFKPDSMAWHLLESTLEEFEINIRSLWGICILNLRTTLGLLLRRNRPAYLPHGCGQTRVGRRGIRESDFKVRPMSVALR